MTRLCIWTNHTMTPPQQAVLQKAAAEHDLVVRPGARSAPELAQADVAFGQPPLADAVASGRLRWVQLSSAGFGSYDTAAARAAFGDRGAMLTKSSAVYATPCAQHVLSFMLAWARQLPAALANQHGRREWPQSEVRRHSRLLEDQKVVLVGYGCIGARLSELLRPLSSNIVGVRQRVRGDEAVDTIAFDSPRFATELGSADHVVNLLPGTAATAGFFDRARLRLIRRGARFYNVGRGTTVDQVTLAQLLKTGHLAAALLDVTDPEPLPPGDALWQAPNCVITPHSAGGHHDEGDRLVQHFVDNFERYIRAEPVIDRAF